MKQGTDLTGKIMLATVLCLFWPFTLWAFCVDAKIRDVLFGRMEWR